MAINWTFWRKTPPPPPTSDNPDEWGYYNDGTHYDRRSLAELTRLHTALGITPPLRAGATTTEMVAQLAAEAMTHTPTEVVVWIPARPAFVTAPDINRWGYYRSASANWTRLSNADMGTLATALGAVPVGAPPFTNADYITSITTAATARAATDPVVWVGARPAFLVAPNPNTWDFFQLEDNFSNLNDVQLRTVIDALGMPEPETAPTVGEIADEIYDEALLHDSDEAVVWVGPRPTFLPRAPRIPTPARATRPTRTATTTTTTGGGTNWVPLGIIAGLALLVVGGFLAWNQFHGDGDDNVRTATADALRPLPETAPDSTLLTALSDKLHGEDFTVVLTSVAGARQRSVTPKEIADALDKGSGSTAADTAALIAAVQHQTTPPPVGTTPGAGQTVAPGNPAGNPGGGTVNTGANCPTDTQMQAAHGYAAIGLKPVKTGDNVAWEGCKWNFDSLTPFNTVMLQGWQYTAKMPDDSIVVWLGDGQTRAIKGTTYRYLAAYNTAANNWVNDPCTLLDREAQFGHDPKRGTVYDTLNGNVPCASYNQKVVTNPGAGTTPAVASTSCFADAAAVAAKVGGDVNGWLQEDKVNFPNTWKYKLKGTNVQLTHPGAPVKTIDYWNGGVATATSAGALPVLVDEVTVKC